MSVFFVHRYGSSEAPPTRGQAEVQAACEKKCGKTAGASSKS